MVPSSSKKKKDLFGYPRIPSEVRLMIWRSNTTHKIKLNQRTQINNIFQKLLISVPGKILKAIHLLGRVCRRISEEANEATGSVYDKNLVIIIFLNQEANFCWVWLRRSRVINGPPCSALRTGNAITFVSYVKGKYFLKNLQLFNLYQKHPLKQIKILNYHKTFHPTSTNSAAVVKYISFIVIPTGQHRISLSIASDSIELWGFGLVHMIWLCMNRLPHQHR